MSEERQEMRPKGQDVEDLIEKISKILDTVSPDEVRSMATRMSNEPNWRQAVIREAENLIKRVTNIPRNQWFIAGLTLAAAAGADPKLQPYLNTEFTIAAFAYAVVSEVKNRKRH